MKSRSLLLMTAVVACGGGSAHRTTSPTAPASPGTGIQLQPVVAEQTFYRSVSTCGQGPFELELPIGNAPHGEEVELLVKTPHSISLHAVIAIGGEELASADGVLAAGGWTEGTVQNTRCIADVRERLAGRRGGGGGAGGGSAAGVPGVRVGESPPAAPSVAAQLEVTTGIAVGAVSVVHLRIPDHLRTAGSVRIRFWSIEPNDLEGVLFGLSHIVWRPNVSEERYAAYLAENAARAEAERIRLEQVRIEEQRRRDEDEARRIAARQEAYRREEALRAKKPRVVVVETEAQRRAREAADREARERQARDEAEARERQARRDAEQRARAEADRLAEIEAARQRELAAERRRVFCVTHPDDRGCWGPGGMKIHLELEQRRADAAVYCKSHHEDARCWTQAERSALAMIDQKRMMAALHPKQPSGPPPSPQAETMPPKLSVNAEWRPGYWQWIDETWVWLGGMWRVPERDIVAELTTTAPAAPPAIRVEAPPPPPVHSAVWTAGFWQWDGAAWVWVAGSWQLRPTASVTWRATAWQPRGSIHVLVPGGWVRSGAKR